MWIGGRVINLIIGNFVKLVAQERDVVCRPGGQQVYAVYLLVVRLWGWLALLNLFQLSPCCAIKS